MTIAELEKDAAIAASAYEINWEQLEDERYRKDFVSSLEMGIALVEELESLYVKLSNNQSVVFPDTDSPLPFNDIEKYRMLIGQELYSSYVFREIYHKYKMVEAVMSAALDTTE